MRFAKILGYCAVFFAASVALWETRPHIRYHLRDEKYACIREALYEDKENVDIGFFGSSRIWTSVDTPFLNAKFPEERAYDFGVNWPGANQVSLLVRDALRARPLKKVVIEISEQSQETRHHYFRFLATTQDAWNEVQRGFGGLSRRDWLTASQALRIEITNAHDVFLPLAVKGLYGSVRDLFPSACQSYPDGYLALEKKHAVDGVGWGSTGNYRAPSEWVQDIARTARAHGASLYFLFVPHRTEKPPTPEFVAALKKMGTVLILPAISDPSLWADEGHLNARGARLFTEALARSALYTQPVLGTTQARF